MFWIKFFVIFFLFVISLIILVPYRYKILGSYHEGFEGEIYIYPLFGIVVIILKIIGNNKYLTIQLLSFKREIQIKRLKKETNKKTNIIKNLKNQKSKTLITRINISYMMRVLGKIISSIKPNRLLIDFKIGFEDPMWTGLLFSVFPMISLNNKYRIKIEPVFNEEILQGSGEIHGKIWIPVIIKEFIRLFLNKPVRNVFIKT